ncbi:uncharacterized protein [Macaca fascicularis]|uniref:uncharacterized protein n=1 Tax=Macaca fascicularis TaxID=9541 RepID=UPI0032B078F9
MGGGCQWGLGNDILVSRLLVRRSPIMGDRASGDLVIGAHSVKARSWKAQWMGPCWPWLFDRHFYSAVETILESEKKSPTQRPVTQHSHLCEELVPNSGSLFGKNICCGKTCCICGLKSLLELDRDGEFQSERSPKSHQPRTSIFPPPMSRLLPVTLASSQCCWGTSGSAGGHGTAPAPGGRPCGSSRRSGSSCAWRWSPPGGSPWPDSQAGGAWRRLGISLDMHPASPRTCRAMHQLGGESPMPRQAQRPPFPT